MMRPSDSQPSITGRGSFAQHLDAYLSQLIQVSNSIRKLNQMVEPDDEERCIGFKHRQLHHQLSGDGLAVDKLKGEFPEFMREALNVKKEASGEMLQWSDSEESHLGVLHARDVGCHYPELSDDSIVSALDLHGGEGWCQKCPACKEHRPDFSVGKLNPFSCWRRGHQSGKLGFVQFSSLSNSEGIISLQPDSVLAPPALRALLHHECSEITLGPNSPISTVGTMMVAIFIIDDKQSQEDRLVEIKGILPAQLLVSRHIDPSMNRDSSRGEKYSDKFPEMVEDLLDAIHSTWKRRGPSRDSRGIIGVALVNNGCEYVSDGGLQSTLGSFGTTNQIWVGNYDAKKLANGFRESMLISDSDLRPNSAALYVILDPIVDLGVIEQ